MWAAIKGGARTGGRLALWTASFVNWNVLDPRSVVRLVCWGFVIWWKASASLSFPTYALLERLRWVAWFEKLPSAIDIEVGRGVHRDRQQRVAEVAAGNDNNDNALSLMFKHDYGC